MLVYCLVLLLVAAVLQGSSANQVEHEQLLILSPATGTLKPSPEGAEDTKPASSSCSKNDIRKAVTCYSFVWLSASAPVLWYQVPNLGPRPPVVINPDGPAQAAAFRAHVEGLRKEYQGDVFILDVLRAGDRREGRLKQQLEQLVASGAGGAAAAGDPAAGTPAATGAAAAAAVAVAASVVLLSRELWCGGRWQLQKELQQLQPLLLPYLRNGPLACSTSGSSSTSHGSSGHSVTTTGRSTNSSSVDGGGGCQTGPAMSGSVAAGGGGGGGVLRVHSFECCDRVGLVGGWLAVAVLEEQLRREGLLVVEQQLGDIMPQVRRGVGGGGGSWGRVGGFGGFVGWVGGY